MAFPSLGALVAKELGKRDVPLPNLVCIGRGPQEAVGAGFLRPNHQPLAVSDPARGLRSEAGPFTRSTGARPGRHTAPRSTGRCG